MLAVRIVKADPERGGDLRVIGRHPDIAVAAALHVDCARLACHRRARSGQLGARALGGDGLQQAVHQVRRFAADHAAALSRVGVDHVALRVLHPADEKRLIVGAAVSEGCIGGR